MRLFKAIVTDVNSGKTEEYNVSANCKESARVAVLAAENIQTPNYQVDIDEYEGKNLPANIDIYGEDIHE